MEKEIYEKPIAELVKIETRDICSNSSIELPDDDFGDD